MVMLGDVYSIHHALTHCNYCKSYITSLGVKLTSENMPRSTTITPRAPLAATHTSFNFMASAYSVRLFGDFGEYWLKQDCN
jgi:hypothetical protein